ncbi:hypothetical protein LOK49_LG05G02236 [Camellia lanceoleosa]|uniref:Uncharacterized protein n=1 Tax=Camellia lanceoleosa TaxID=1840588 RepID=A0ACC0HRJ3_9ERIC|nr:hypothetical protein LOK49_LG05G02236 [Camellia lanceoleosa]
MVYAVSTLFKGSSSTLTLHLLSAFALEVKWLHLPPPHHAEIKRLHASESRFALFTPLSLFLLLLLTHIEQHIFFFAIPRKTPNSGGGFAIQRQKLFSVTFGCDLVTSTTDRQLFQKSYSRSRLNCQEYSLRR